MLQHTFNILTKLGFYALLLASSFSYAAQPGHIKITSSAQEQITVLNEQGQRVQKLIPPTSIIPGDITYYTNTFQNMSNETAHDIAITNAIPKHTVYIPNSAETQNFEVSYSVDGGKHWGKPEQLKVKNNQGKWVQAKPSDYTHIHWQYLGALNPKEKKTVNFKVKLI